jgi:hypothetical protein
MKKPLIIGLIAAVAVAMVYLLFRPKTQGTGGLSVSGARPIYPTGNPSFAWGANPITGVVSGNPVPLSPSIGLMPPSTVTPFRTATTPSTSVNPTFGGAPIQNPSPVTTTSAPRETINGVQIGTGYTDYSNLLTAPDSVVDSATLTQIPSLAGYQGSDAGYDNASLYDF